MNIFRILFFTLAIFLLNNTYLHAEETIRILMMESPYDPLPSNNAKRLYSLDGKVYINNRFYEGHLEIYQDGSRHYLINTMPMEKYIEGVVYSEIGNDGELEALKAQAVIARTYAIYNKWKNEKDIYHLSSSALHQLYSENNTDPLISYAVMVTRGEILTFNNLPANTVYHDTCEGKTELPEEVWEESYPYLKSVECYGRNAPFEKWKRRFDIKKIEKALNIKNIRHISIGTYTATKRVKSLDIIYEDNKGREKSTTIRAIDFRRMLGFERLPSTHFSLAQDGNMIILTGKGHGHGVGLSQQGALAMAKEGKNYREILAHYYPGTELRDDSILKYHVLKLNQ